MRIETAQGLDDSTLAHLYSEWSEEKYCAGWMMDCEADMAAELVTGSWPPSWPYDHCECDYRLHPLPQYATEGVAVIRRVLAEEGRA